MEAQVPGGAFVNEVDGYQEQIPGGVFLDGTGTTYVPTFFLNS